MAPSEIELSPGEIERYNQEMAHRLRCERLVQVRRAEDARARASRLDYLRNQRREQREHGMAEAHSQLEAKRAQLETLLQERRACELVRGQAERAAEVHALASTVHNMRLIQDEAHQRELENRRAAEALHRQQEAKRKEAQEVREKRNRQWQTRQVENQRALDAAGRSRQRSAVREAAAQEAQRQANREAQLVPPKVPVTKYDGKEDYTQTCYHVAFHSPGDRDNLLLEAEHNRPLSPAPCPTPLQLQRADQRGRAAETASIAKKCEKEIEQRLAAEEVRWRLAKTRRAASAGARGRRPSWGAPPGTRSQRKAAEEEMDKLLGGKGVQTKQVDLDHWRESCYRVRPSRLHQDDFGVDMFGDNVEHAAEQQTAQNLHAWQHDSHVQHATKMRNIDSPVARNQDARSDHSGFKSSVVSSPSLVLCFEASDTNDGYSEMGNCDNLVEHAATDIASLPKHGDEDIGFKSTPSVVSVPAFPGLKCHNDSVCDDPCPGVSSDATPHFDRSGPLEYESVSTSAAQQTLAYEHEMPYEVQTRSVGCSPIPGQAPSHRGHEALAACSSSLEVSDETCSVMQPRTERMVNLLNEAEKLLTEATAARPLYSADAGSEPPLMHAEQKPQFMPSLDSNAKQNAHGGMLEAKPRNEASKQNGDTSQLANLKEGTSSFRSSPVHGWSSRKWGAHNLGAELENIWKTFDNTCK